MIIYLLQKLQKTLTFFKLSHGWQMLERSLALKMTKNVFAKYVITNQTREDEDDIVDEELNACFNELVNSECDMTLEEYVKFDAETCSSLLQSAPI